MSKEQLGIDSINPKSHVRTTEYQDKENELIFTNNFLLDFIFENEFDEIKGKMVSIDFINYGDTELVYVIKTDDGKYYTLLVGQPSTELGQIKEEYNNLLELSKNNDSIIKPLYYFTNNEKEAFVTPYIYQARCIASKHDEYGIYVPEPEYDFKKLNDEEDKLIKSCMIANLIKAHDGKKGIVEARIGGGDFILKKEFNAFPQTIESTLKNMKLTAARSLKEISLEDYINLLREELTKITYYRNLKERDNSIIINQKNRASMTNEEIEDGIALGLKLREENK